MMTTPTEQTPAASVQANFIHIICDEQYCTHALSLGISETVEEAIGRANDMMRRENIGPGAIHARPGLVHVPDNTIADTVEVRALNAAAVLLGWRRVTNPDGSRSVFCPGHATGLACAHCERRNCRCTAGPRFDVVRR